MPQLYPQENIWQFMRDNWLSNRVFGSYDEIVDHCCHAWNKLVEQPWEDHVYRPARLGICVLTTKFWYNRACVARPTRWNLAERKTGIDIHGFRAVESDVFQFLIFKGNVVVLARR